MYCPGPPGVPQCHLSQSKAQSQQRCAGCPTASVGPAGLVWSCDFPILSRCWACRHGWGSPRATNLGAVAWTGIGSGVTSEEGDSRQSSLPFLLWACEHSRGDARPCASHLFRRVTCLPPPPDPGLCSSENSAYPTGLGWDELIQVSSAWKWKRYSLTLVLLLFATPWTIARQASLSMDFSR